MIQFSVQKQLADTFARFWTEFQQFNIMRTKRINEIMGHLLDGQIMQIVCWHHFLASINEQEKTSLPMMNVLMHGIRLLIITMYPRK